jgi:hypothetical protein
VKRDYLIGGLASRQAGLVGHDQAIGIGLSEASIKYRLRRGLWNAEGRGLYRVSGISGDYKGLLRAAVAILPDATVSHESAAEIHGMSHIRRRMAVVTVHAGTTHYFPDVVIHRSIDLFPHHKMTMNDLSVTTPARTLVDMAAKISRSHMAIALDENVAAGKVAMDHVRSVFDEVARRGRDGTANLRSILSERLGSDLISASRLERVGMRVFVSGGLERPIFQYPAPWDPSRKIDFAWPHRRVGCECDSRRWHTRSNDFQVDRTRDNLAEV